MKQLFNTVFILSCILGVAQNVEIATFLHGAQGAYTITHDNFCADDTPGISAYADSMALSHGINFNFSIITGKCDSLEWEAARKLIKHGHEAAGNTHRHYCGLPVSWCPTKTFDSTEFDIEYKLSRELIIEKLGVIPAFQKYSFTLYNKQMIDYVESLGYTASFCGHEWGFNYPKTMQLKRPGTQNLRPRDGIIELNKLASDAIKNNQWAIRLTLGVHDSSWSSITLNEYEKHLSYLEEKKKTGELWVAVFSEVHSYVSAMRTSTIDTVFVSPESSAFLIRGKKEDFELTIQTSNTRSIKKVLINGNETIVTERNGHFFFNARVNKPFTIYYE